MSRSEIELSLPWKDAIARVNVRPADEQQRVLTTRTRVLVTFRIPLELTFRHTRTPAGVWSRIGTPEHPKGDNWLASAQRAIAELHPLVDDLVARPDLQEQLDQMRRAALDRQGAAAWSVLSGARARAAQAAAELRQADERFRSFGVSEGRAAELVHEQDQAIRRALGFPAPRW